YIIWSKKLGKSYVGTTDDFDRRLAEHNNNYYDNTFTTKGIPWKAHLVIDNLTSKQAFAIEEHIKKMKSKKYIENLAKFPEMIDKLRKRFDPDSYRD
ncbi:MAG: putative endonuclease, partial [Arenicella sp.]